MVSSVSSVLFVTGAAPSALAALRFDASFEAIVEEEPADDARDKLAQVFGTSTNGSCYQPPPSMGDADMTENSTHVVYECNAGYEFPDRNTSKVWECGCAALANLEPCLPSRSNVLCSQGIKEIDIFDTYIKCLTCAYNDIQILYI